jgi:endonuclease/exonuclease/phosphatase (EEP) superfamily protein YafD
MGNVGYFEFVKADTGYLFHSTRFDRMEYYDSMHAVQAQMIKKQLNNTRHPYIFCADMNAVPSGYVYQHVKEGLRDAFLMAGSGLGGTYHRFSFTLRIDDMLTSPDFTAIQYSSPHLDLSDHYPLLADFQIRK